MRQANTARLAIQTIRPNQSVQLNPDGLTFSFPLPIDHMVLLKSLSSRLPLLHLGQIDFAYLIQLVKLGT
jgi:hypothetical protein